jgi:hypothetical protein
MNMKTSIVMFLASVAVLSAGVRAYAMAGNLAQPSIALPEGTPKEVRERIISALNDKECMFLEGHFINAHTTLLYGGGTKSLNQMLNRLAECDYFRIKIRFIKQESGAAWTVTHNAWANNEDLEVQVNLAVEAIQVEKLDIPVLGRSGQQASPLGGR